MQNTTAVKAKNTAQQTNNAHRLSSESTALHDCFGKIGISAVAAAARYQGSAKNPAYAPVPTNWTDHSDEAV